MDPQPCDGMRGYVGCDLLAGRRAPITGGDSGVGRAVAVAFAEEGADPALSYLDEDDAAARTRTLVERRGRGCVLLPGDIADRDHCSRLVDGAAAELGGLDSGSTTPRRRSRSGRSRTSPTSRGTARWQ